MKDNKGKSKIKPVVIEDGVDTMSTSDFVDEFGAAALESANNFLPASANKDGVQENLQMVIEVAKQLTLERRSQSLTRLDVLKEQTDSLGDCVSIASEIYKNMPIPDHAYQLSALASAFNASLSQVDKMQDPVDVLNQINEQVMTMFNRFLKDLALEIDRVRKEFKGQYPGRETHIDESFNRMLKTMSPNTQELYDGLQSELRKILGIKRSSKAKGADREGSH